jgi:hypothetical protein
MKRFQKLLTVVGLTGVLVLLLVIPLHVEAKTIRLGGNWQYGGIFGKTCHCEEHTTGDCFCDIIVPEV